MVDHQKIHPVYLEAGHRPSAPLVPGGSFRSDKGDPTRADQQPRRVPDPTPRRSPDTPAAPHAPPLPPPKRRRGCCCRLLCCVLVTVVVLAVLVAEAAADLYLAFDPKAPRYSVDRLSVSAFQVDPALMAHARFNVAVTAVNPNARISIYYEPDPASACGTSPTAWPAARCCRSTRATATRRCWPWPWAAMCSWAAR